MLRTSVWKMIGFSVLLCVVIFHAGIVLAGIGVQPTVVEIEATPGVEKSGTLVVANGDPESTTVKVEPEDWLKLRTGSTPADVKSWLTVDNNFTLGPNATKNIGYKVNIPQGVKGEVVAQVFFSSAVQGGGTVNITSRFGIALYVGIEGTETIYPEIKELKVDGMAVKVTIVNHGNVHLRPYGKVIIKDAKGNVTGQGDIPYTAVIYGGQSHVYSVSMDEKSFSHGDNKVEANMVTGNIYGQTKAFSKVVSFSYK